MNYCEIVINPKQKNFILVCDTCHSNFNISRVNLIRRKRLRPGIRISCSPKCFSNRTREKLKQCLGCGSNKIAVDGLKFCSQSCAATYNNKNKIFHLKCSDCNVNLISKSKKNLRCNNCKLLHRNKYQLNRISKKKNRICKNSNCYISPEKNREYCESCRLLYYKIYRPSCEFNFDIYKFKDSIPNFYLLKDLGRYSPTNKGNNLKGASLDHMYSVKQGFSNSIDSAIISHPANCQILAHSKNSSKGTKSTITLEELLIRVNVFETFKN